ncbi:uncharacterized protein LOC134230983 [Saccostrea cucullata]|uniref:uncharacterized protein LOC134230983 n=1 Tax=Saccostrea cuccullata TaxID=36930 RepID=UPI002ED188E1
MQESQDAVDLDLNLGMYNFPEYMDKEDMGILNTTLDGIVNMLSGLDNKLNDVNTKMNDLDNKLDKLKCYNSSGFCYISAQLSPITKSLTGKTKNEREGSTYQKKEGPGGSGESKKIKQMDPCYVLVKDLEKTEEKTLRKPRGIYP